MSELFGRAVWRQPAGPLRLKSMPRFIAGVERDGVVEFARIPQVLVG